MGFFEQLGSFVRFGQFVGLFPYRIDKSMSGRFKRFVFSWFHIITGWFIVSICLQIVPTLATWAYVFWQDQEFAKVSNLNSQPQTIFVIFGLSIIAQYIKIVVVRVVSLRYNLLGAATNDLNTHVIKELEDVHDTFDTVQNYATIKKRTIAGIVLIVIKALCEVISRFTSFNQYTRSSGVTLNVLTYMGNFLNYLANDSILLFIHLCYYSIAYYIQLLRTSLTTNNKQNQLHQLANKPQLWNKGIRRALLDLRHASAHLGAVFSVPVLFVITTQLAFASFYSFAIIYAILRTNQVYTLSFIASMLFQLIGSLSSVLVILHAADMPAHQIRFLREQVITLSNARHQRSIGDHLELSSLLQHLDEERFCLSAAGLFKPSMRLLPAVAGSIVTYLVILLQNQFN